MTTKGLSDRVADLAVERVAGLQEKEVMSSKK